MKTYQATNENVTRNWHLIDASDRTLGRLAGEIARRLRGKHKPEYTAHVDTGDFVVVINAEKIRVSGNKSKAKMYYRYSGYQSGLKETSFEDLMAKHPDRIIEIAVKGMLPKNPLGRGMLKKLKVYAGPEHPHTAQNPQLVDAKQLDAITGEG